MSAVRHRVHVMPRLRRVGGVVLPNWLAITIGRDIFAWRELSATELRHELQHVRQWARHGVAFPLLYVGASLRSLLSGGGWYRGNRFEVEARGAETDAAGSE
jgi:hypothetical protein